MRARYLVGSLVAILTIGIGCAGIQTVEEQHKSPHFDAVVKKLDVGGTVFLYADTDGDMQAFAEFLDGIVKGVAQEVDEPWIKKIDVRGMFEKLGVDGMQATGLSSYKDGKVYRNKAFIKLAGPRKGLMLAAGGPPRALEVPRLAPKDVDLAMETDLNLKAVADVIAEVMKDVMGPEADKLLAQLEQPIPGLGLSARQIIDELDTRLVFVLRMDVENALRLPFLPVPIPKVDLLLAVDNLGMLFELVQGMLKSMPGIEQGKEGALDVLTIAKALPGGLQPVVARDPKSKRLFAATSLAFLKEYLDPSNGLATSPGFAVATRGFPKKGNAIAYMGPKYMGKVLDFVDQAVQAFPEAKPYVGLAHALLPEPGIAMASIQANLPDGLYSASNETTSHKSTLAMTLYANPLVATFVLGSLVARMGADDGHGQDVRIAGVEKQVQMCAAVASALKPAKGKKVPALPAGLPMVCPTHAKSFTGLDKQTSPLAYGNARAGYEKLGWVIKDPVHGCVQFEHTLAADPKSPATFTCHAWTDMDDDNVMAHWSIRGIWSPEASTFQLGSLERASVKN